MAKRGVAFRYCLLLFIFVWVSKTVRCDKTGPTPWKDMKDSNLRNLEYGVPAGTTKLSNVIPDSYVKDLTGHPWMFHQKVIERICRRKPGNNYYECAWQQLSQLKHQLDTLYAIKKTPNGKGTPVTWDFITVAYHFKVCRIFRHGPGSMGPGAAHGGPHCPSPCAARPCKGKLTRCVDISQFAQQHMCLPPISPTGVAVPTSALLGGETSLEVLDYLTSGKKTPGTVPATKAATKAATKPATTTATKAATKPATTTATKAATTPATTTATKAATTPATTTATKAETKPANKGVTTAATKPSSTKRGTKATNTATTTATTTPATTSAATNGVVARGNAGTVTPSTRPVNAAPSVRPASAHVATTTHAGEKGSAPTVTAIPATTPGAVRGTQGGEARGTAATGTRGPGAPPTPTLPGITRGPTGPRSTQSPRGSTSPSAQNGVPTVRTTATQRPASEQIKPSITLGRGSVGATHPTIRSTNSAQKFVTGQPAVHTTVPTAGQVTVPTAGQVTVPTAGQTSVTVLASTGTQASSAVVRATKPGLLARLGKIAFRKRVSVVSGATPSLVPATTGSTPTGGSPTHTYRYGPLARSLGASGAPWTAWRFFSPVRPLLIGRRRRSARGTAPPTSGPAPTGAATLPSRVLAVLARMRAKARGASLTQGWPATTRKSPGLTIKIMKGNATPPGGKTTSSSAPRGTAAARTTSGSRAASPTGARTVSGTGPPPAGGATSPPAVRVIIHPPKQTTPTVAGTPSVAGTPAAGHSASAARSTPVPWAEITDAEVRKLQNGVPRNVKSLRDVISDGYIKPVTGHGWAHHQTQIKTLCRRAKGTRHGECVWRQLSWLHRVAGVLYRKKNPSGGGSPVTWDRLTAAYLYQVCKPARHRPGPTWVSPHCPSPCAAGPCDVTKHVQSGNSCSDLSQHQGAYRCNCAKSYRWDRKQGHCLPTGTGTAHSATAEPSATVKVTASATAKAVRTTPVRTTPVHTTRVQTTPASTKPTAELEVTEKVFSEESSEESEPEEAEVKGPTEEDTTEANVAAPVTVTMVTTAVHKQAEEANEPEDAPPEPVKDTPEVTAEQGAEVEEEKAAEVDKEEAAEIEVEKVAEAKAEKAPEEKVEKVAEAKAEKAAEAKSEKVPHEKIEAAEAKEEIAAEVEEVKTAEIKEKVAEVEAEVEAEEAEEGISNEASSGAGTDTIIAPPEEAGRAEPLPWEDFTDDALRGFQHGYPVDAPPEGLEEVLEEASPAGAAGVSWEERLRAAGKECRGEPAKKQGGCVWGALRTLKRDSDAAFYAAQPYAPGGARNPVTWELVTVAYLYHVCGHVSVPGPPGTQPACPSACTARPCAGTRHALDTPHNCFPLSQLAGEYRCECARTHAWNATSMACEVDAAVCDDPERSPCEAPGTSACEARDGRVICACAEGFTGEFCSLPAPELAHQLGLLTEEAVAGGEALGESLWTAVKWPVLISVLVLLGVLAGCIYICCRASKGKEDDKEAGGKEARSRSTVYSALKTQ